MSFWRKKVIESALDAEIGAKIQEQRAIVAHEPLSAKAWFGLGSLYHVQGEKDGARTCFLRAIEIDSSFSPAYLALGRLYAVEGNLGLAWSYARRAESLGDNSLCQQLSRYSNPPEAIEA
jgi:tetratricopeptide (TPR) repeat protein